MELNREKAVFFIYKNRLILSHVVDINKKWKDERAGSKIFKGDLIYP
jgi:hypothetical protein